jgi:hypothetical protein
MTSTITRRDAIRTGSGLVLGFCLPLRGRTTSEKEKLNAWVSITPDNRITLLTQTPEMGQGTRTANAMMLAEELEVDWVTVQVEQVPSDPAVYKHLTTGGSAVHHPLTSHCGKQEPRRANSCWQRRLNSGMHKRAIAALNTRRLFTFRRAAALVMAISSRLHRNFLFPISAKSR